MVTPSTWIQPHYQQVKVEGGVVPCVSGPLSITVTNIGHQRVVLPKHAVITEIYPFDARFVQEEVNTNKTTTYEIPQFQNIQLKQNRKCIALTKAVKDLHIKPKKKLRLSMKRQRKHTLRVFTTAPVLHDRTPYEDAEIETVPRKPPIPSTEPLPTDLQDLANRCSNLTTNQQKQVESLLRTHHDVFASDPQEFGDCPWTVFRIDTGTEKPIKQQARPIPIHYRQAAYDQLMAYIKNGTLIPSQSPWASPIHCVKKKCGAIRLTVDYRQLNKISRIPACPIPRTQELLRKVANFQYRISGFDLQMGYHNVRIHPNDQPKTAIAIQDDLGLPSRLYQFTRLAFGLSAAPAEFQYVTDRLVTPAKVKTPANNLGDTYGVYLDDVAISSDSFEQMTQRLTAFFNRVRASKMLKAKKCSIFQKGLKYLGHTVGPAWIHQIRSR